MHNLDGTANIANLMAQGGDQYLGPREDLLKIKLGAIAQLLRRIENDRSQPGAGFCLISRKPYMSEKHLTILPAAPALHLGVKHRRLVLRRWNTCKRRKEPGDRLPLQLALLDAKEPVRRFVREQHVAIRIERENRRRAAR